MSEYVFHLSGSREEIDLLPASTKTTYYINI